MSLQVFLLLLLCCTGSLVQGFGPFGNFESLSPFVPMSPLQALVSFRAIGSSLYNTLQKDFGSENLIFDAVFKSHYHPEMDAIYFGLVTLSALKTAEPETESRLSDIKIYADNYKKTRIIFFVLAVILTKNIENAV